MEIAVLLIERIDLPVLLARDCSELLVELTDLRIFDVEAALDVVNRSVLAGAVGA